MLLKKIVCTVERKVKEDFHQAQLSWELLKDAPGFYCQYGGWKDHSEGHSAYIMAMWANESAYHHFMSSIHDDIFIQSNQKQTYTSIQVELVSQEISILEIKEYIKELRDNRFPLVNIISIEQDIDLVNEWTVIGKLF